jgi:hypothetical protein
MEETIKPPGAGDLSKVPYAEPTWLSNGYFSPYYTDNHRKFQKALRKYFMEVVYPEAVKCEENGKKISQDVVDKMGCVHFCYSYWNCLLNQGIHWCRQENIIAMRLGPGKHLKGRTLLGGIVKPEEFDYFYEVSICLHTF